MDKVKIEFSEFDALVTFTTLLELESILARDNSNLCASAVVQLLISKFDEAVNDEKTK